MATKIIQEDSMTKKHGCSPGKIRVNGKCIKPRRGIDYGIPKYISRKELLYMLREYDHYIQEANDEQKYKTGWMPVCIDEFYDNEWQDIKAWEQIQEGIIFYPHG